MSRSPNEDNVFNTFATSLSQAAGNLTRQIGRTAASAHELLSDADLRRKGTSLIVHEASKGIREIQQKVGHAAGNLSRSLQQGITSGPRQIQSALERVRTRVHEAKLANELELHQNMTVDVQICGKLFTDAPQELRSRLWAAMLTPPDPRNTDLIDLHSEGDSNSSKDADWELLENPKIQTSSEQKTVSSERFSVDLESILEQMGKLEWPLKEEITPDSKYSTLIQITVGQDEVDDVIRRDIHRTFPELPHFNYQSNCSALFNILKAYSLHDLEVGYCQGMGFLAGILLIYLPEEWAFRMFCYLMEEGRSNLRKLYLPGLVALKLELWKLEWLLDRHCSILIQHFRRNGVAAVLYASQWYLTSFACPFNENFAARVLDMIIIEQNSTPLVKLAFAVLTELGEGLLELDNLEDILTAIKVKPLSWDMVTVRRVMSSALDSPVSQEDIDLAEEIYHQLQDEAGLGVGGEVSEKSEQEGGGGGLQSSSSLPLRGETGRDDQQQLIEDDLEFMLSMDLLIDVDGSSQEVIKDSEEHL